MNQQEYEKLHSVISEQMMVINDFECLNNSKSITHDEKLFTLFCSLWCKLFEIREHVRTKIPIQSIKNVS